MSKNALFMKLGKEQSKTGSSVSIKRRQILSNVFTPSTSALFHKAAIQKGTFGLDLACGLGDNTLLLKSMVGPKGKIKGIDSNSVYIKIAKEKAIQNKVDQVDFRYQNILEWDENQTYDFVYCNLFFLKLANQSTILQHIHQSLKPGGLTVVEYLEFPNFFCFPNCFAFDRLIELYKSIEHQQKDSGLNIGTQLKSKFHKAGFENIKVQQASPSFLTGKNKRIASLTLEHMAPILIDKKLSTTTELQVLIFELKNFEKQKNSMITLPGIYQVLGYRPERGKHPAP